MECCEDCEIFILDNTEQVQISECKNCRVVVGPCIGSVFLLECTGCTFYRAEPVPKHWGSLEWPDTYSGGRWGPPCVPQLELASGSGQE